MSTYSEIMERAGQRVRFESVLARAKQKVGLSEGPAGEETGPAAWERVLKASFPHC